MLANFSENLIINESIIIAFAFVFLFGFQWWFPNFTYLYFSGYSRLTAFGQVFL